MRDLSKNPVEEKIIAHMQKHGASMDDLDAVLVHSKVELDRLARQLQIDPSTYVGQEQAAVVFVKGVVVYGLLDAQEKQSFLVTLRRLWGDTSRFTAQITGAVANRVAGIQNGMGWEELPNNLFVKEYAAIVHAARLIDLPVTGLEYGSATIAAGELSNAFVKSKTGQTLVNTSQIERFLSRMGINGAKVVRGAGIAGAVITVSSMTVQKRIQLSLDNAKEEAERRLAGTANKYTMEESYFDSELKSYDLYRDKASVK